MAKDNSNKEMADVNKKKATKETTKSNRKSTNQSSSSSKKEYVAFILVRGLLNVNPQKRYTLDSLKLKRKHSLLIGKNTPDLNGMIRSLNEMGVWAELSKETIDALNLGNPEYSSESFSIYRLSPPRHGFRKTIKKTTPKGILGKKNEESFLELLNRMIGEKGIK